MVEIEQKDIPEELKKPNSIPELSYLEKWCLEALSKVREEYKLKLH